MLSLLLPRRAARRHPPLAQENKPATFIYPSYSLVGDMRMMYDVARAQSLTL